ncbi:MULTISPECIES: HEPN domain-containing protein [Bacillus]|uniref:HEPN domain-containing protein n=1 Tax=Bacillus TaxID=1386 RepID=UPI00111E51AA|nr:MULTISPECIES: HEPN domain-containing protein [Bacillus amyloliquefaciens group]MEC2217034.1 HEPN domain-containing protein [Bacillus velezensis]QVL92961.1 hypothetical protein KH277_16000 [Bacillus velezensis]TNU32080.1 hypothetical protein FH493_17365 [Bacillus velezensis]WEU37795.1 HEPN domain-containing protein [Bacillus amyloliquefaciens]WFO88029.1 hypothetical protein JEQ16_03415 [Bacillus velezensis]
MKETIVDAVYKQNYNLLKYLEMQKEVSFQQDMDNKLKKVLLVSAASFFETSITELLVKFFNIKAGNNPEIVAFLKNKAISRQYHSYFDWEKSNINKFLGLFGEEFKKQAAKDIKEQELDQSVKAFLTLGNLRNQLVHQNMATIYIEQTSEEIYFLYKEALKMISFIESKLK